MKLDRNKNPDGTGKYALLKMRELNPILNSSVIDERKLKIAEAYTLLRNEGFIHYGNESPGDQFFVMKYKDKFTHSGLKAYADAVSSSAFNGDIDDSNELHQYAAEIYREASGALKIGHRIPD